MSALGHVDLRKRGTVTKVRALKTGRPVGGIPFTRGPLAHLLRNRFYIGEVVFKGEVLPGEQPAILDRRLFENVQAKLNEQHTKFRRGRVMSEALLAGRIFDDRGHRMTPSHARKAGIKYRYYISTALLQGQAEQAGSVNRVPAEQIEAAIVKSIRSHLGVAIDIEDAVLVREHLKKITVRPERLILELKAAEASKKNGGNRIEISWSKSPAKKRRELLLPASPSLVCNRPIRSENRALLISSIARGRRWLDELVANADAGVEGIAARETCSVRKVNMTISLAFLAPDLVKAAIDGRLPHGMGVTKLCELPAEWSRQYPMLGLSNP